MQDDGWQRIMFGQDRFDLRKRCLAILDRVADFLNVCPGGQCIDQITDLFLELVHPVFRRKAGGLQLRAQAGAFIMIAFDDGANDIRGKQLSLKAGKYALFKPIGAYAAAIGA
nr:hypothetical protein [Sphingobium sp. JAI105]